MEKDGSLIATLDSPAQGARDIPVPSVRLDGDRLQFGLGAFGVRYGGKLSASKSTIDGEWTQGRVATKLSLTRAVDPASAVPLGR